MAFCIECGNALSSDDQFCASCGNTVAAAASAAPTPRVATPTVDVPDWLTAGWGVSAAWAFGTAFIGIVLMYVIGIILVIGLMVSSMGDGIDFGAIDWGLQLKSPIFVWLGLHGTVSGNAMWLTAIAWIVVAFLIAARFGIGTRPIVDGIPSPIVSAAVVAAKTALIYAGIILGFLIFLQPDQPAVGGNRTGLGGSYLEWEPSGAFFSTLLVAFLATWGIRWWTVRPRGEEPSVGSVQQLVVAAFSGTIRILALSLVGLLVFGFAGFAIDLLTADLGVFSWLGSVLMTFVVAIGLLAGVDIAMAMFASAMQFFGGDGGVSDAILGSPGWIIAGTVIVAAAFLWGGYSAARAVGADKLSRIVQASALAGLGVTVAFIITSIVIGGRVPEVRSGIGLSVLWTVVAVGGGLIYAQSVGALQDVLPEAAPVAPAAGMGGAKCPTCSADLPAEAKFCAGCGSSVG